MAGSLNWFRYTDDSQTNYSVFVDESNAEATVGGVRLFLARTSLHPLYNPRSKKRYVNAFCNANPLIKRRFFVGNVLAISQILANAVLNAVAYPTTSEAGAIVEAWTITSYRGEKNALPPAVNATTGDTGLTDDDPAQDA